MNLLPRQIVWSEPWSLEYAKGQVRQLWKAMPSLWRMMIYCVVLPIVVMVVAKVFLPTLEWRVVGTVVLGSVLMFMVMPFVVAVCPVVVHVLKSGIMFQVGSGGSRIDVKYITALSFETHAGKRYFVVHARTRKGVPYERRALLPTKKVTEQDIISFLYEVDLAHLIVESKIVESETVN